MKILIVLSILLMPITSYASDLRDGMEVCESYAKLAKIIMTKRQDDESLVNILDRLKQSPVVDNLLAAAYSRPVMLTAKWREVSISRFSNEAMSHCIGMMPR